MKYTSCRLLEYGISIEKESIKHCCRVIPTNDLEPIILENYDAKNIDWDKIFEIKQKLRKKKQQKEIIPECVGCYAYNAEYWDWDQGNYITHINFNHWMKCNCNCIYCYTQYFKDKSHENIYPAIAELVEKNLFRSPGEVTFQGGEPTVLEEFNDLVDLFLKIETPIRVHSSGVLYNEAIERGLKKGLLSITISPDAGSKEIYKKIKRVDSFDKVSQNIKKYSNLLESNKKHLLKIKYIIVPGYNDSIKDIDDWFKLIKESNVKYVILDIEAIYYKKNPIMPKHMYALIDYIEHKTKKLNLNYELYDSAVLAKNTRKIPKYNLLLNFKPILKLFVEFHKSKNKHKNIEYGKNN